MSQDADQPIRVVLVDDQAMIRAGFKLLIDNQPDLEVVGEAETGSEAVELVRSLQPDVVLMDVQMPDMDGIAATEELLKDGSTFCRKKDSAIRLSNLKRDCSLWLCSS